jgi:carbamate kinase
MSDERVVVALGGNALLRKGDTGTAESQATRCLEAGQVVITHGNGPVVGNILIRQQAARRLVPPMPLDVCGAESQGNIGYMLERALVQVFRQHGIHRPVATLLSLVEVDPADSAFAQPTKPVGPFFSAAEAEDLRRSVPLVQDAGRGFRRVVASPRPHRIIESAAIDVLLQAGIAVITLGGGGVPVVVDQQQRLLGVEAVIDKDLSSSLLACELRAQTLIILTDIDHVYLEFLSPARRAVTQMNIAEAEVHLQPGEF